MTATDTAPHLKRQLGLWSATTLVVGEVIAVGIFLTPAQMSKTLGSPLLIAVVWLGVGVVALGLPVYWLLFKERKQANDVD